MISILLNIKKNFDNGSSNWWEDEEMDKLTKKQIEDYEALPDIARHPYGSDFPDFSERLKNRDFRDLNNRDKLSDKEPNSIFNKQRKKRKYVNYNGIESDFE